MNNSKCYKCLKAITELTFVSCEICGVISHLECSKINKKDFKVINSYKNLFFKCAICENIQLQNCIQKVRELSILLNNSPNNSLSALAITSITNTSNLNASRNIRSTTRAQRIPIVSDDKKRLSTSVDRRVALKGSSTPLDRVSLKHRRVSITECLSSENSNDIAKQTIASSSSSIKVDGNPNASINMVSPLLSLDGCGGDSEANSSKSADVVIISNVGTIEAVATGSNDVAVDAHNVDSAKNVAVAAGNFDDIAAGVFEKVADNFAAVVSNSDNVAGSSTQTTKDAGINVDVAGFPSQIVYELSNSTAVPPQDSLGAHYLDKQIPFSHVHNKKSKHKQLFGSDADAINALPSIPRRRFIHISRLNKTVTEECVINYTARRLNLPKTSFVCSKLVKKDADISSLHFINFKLGVPAGSLNDALNTSIWPVGVQIKQFTSRPKNELHPKQQNSQT